MGLPRGLPKAPKGLPTATKADLKGLRMKPLEVFEKLMRKRVDNGYIPGYSGHVLYKGKVIHTDSYGWADPKMKLKYKPNTLMRLYCMTKPYVVVGILNLHDRGLLNVHDPIHKYIPSWKHARVAKNGGWKSSKAVKGPPISIMNCLTHTASMPYGQCLNYPCDGPEHKSCDHIVKALEDGTMTELSDFCDQLARVPLRDNPGTRYRYSHSLDVLGRVIEVVTGKTLGRFLEDEIYKPLGMKDTSFYFPKSKANRLAAVYVGRESAKHMGVKIKSKSRSKHLLVRVDGESPFDSQWYIHGKRRCKIESGGGMIGHNMGGLISTVDDSALFLQMLVNGGELNGVRVVKKETMEKYGFVDMLPSCIRTGKKQKEAGTPFGWTVLGEIGVKRGPNDAVPKPKDEFEVGEIGGGGAACTFWTINPRRHFAVVWFTQQMDNDPGETEDTNLNIVARKVCPVDPEVAARLASVKVPRWGKRLSKVKTASKNVRRTAAGRAASSGRKVRKITRKAALGGA